MRFLSPSEFLAKAKAIGGDSKGERMSQVLLLPFDDTN